MNFKNLGPSQDISSNIRSQLDGYKDGLTLFKEMIQNADDAGAQILKICYDKRNSNCSMWSKSLFTDSPKLLEAQGRAIWFYNDAPFTESDFTNIARLGGETKKDSPEKIGKFGRGFCSVYNVTDLPSILSGHSLAIFDPNIDALRKRINDPSNPGVRVDLNERKDMSEFSDQLKPYDGIFNCNIYRKAFSFEGTLIRLPFRKTPSKISDNIYHDDLEIIKLFEFLYQNAKSILLFTQSVKEVQAYILEDTEMKLLFSFNVQPVQFLKTHPLGKPNCLREQSSILKAAIEARSKKFPQVETSVVVKVTLETNVKNLATYLKSIEKEKREFYWSISSSFYDRNLKEGKKGFENFLPCVGIAVQVEWIKNSELNFEETKGSAFCFLPLCIDSGLKYHMNCAFAVSSDRLRIVERTRDDRENLKSLWNDALIDPLVENLIFTIKSLHEQFNSSDPLKFVNVFWPLNSKVGFFEKFEQRFYEKTCSVDSDNAVFPSIKQNNKGFDLVNYARCYFVDFSFTDSQLTEFSCQVIKKITSYFTSIIRLPTEHLKKLKSFEKNQEKFIDEFKFLKLMLENKPKIEKSDFERILVAFLIEKCFDSRDQLTDCGKFIKSNKSVPNRQFELCLPSQLVNPQSYPNFASLDLMELAEIFPSDIIANSQNCLFALQKFGLMNRQLSDNVVVKIASVVGKIGKFNKAKETSESLLAYLSENKTINDLDKLKNIQWILSKEKPDDWPFKWCGSDNLGI